ncbi:MAG: RNA polymerase sigma factor [Planctomycetota bacterium]
MVKETQAVKRWGASRRRISTMEQKCHSKQQRPQECRDGEEPVVRDQTLTEKQLESLLLEYAPVLRAFISKRIPPGLRSTIAPDDVLQEVWMAAFRGLAGFRNNGPSAFKRWIITITGHKVVDFLKAAFALKRYGRWDTGTNITDTSVTGYLPLANVPAVHPTPSGEFAIKESVNAVQAAMIDMNSERARAIRLRHIEGKSIAQVAAVMGKTEPAVSSLLFHGRRDLKERMGQSALYFSDADTSENKGSEEVPDH